MDLAGAGEQQDFAGTTWRGRVACVDGPLGARGVLHDLTSGAMAVMCPASHEGVQVKLSHGVILPA